MREATAVLDHYRNTARTLWNTGFWSDPDLRTWEANGSFYGISRLLFDALVLSKLDLEIPIDEIFLKPIDTLTIVPTPKYGCPILIQGEAVGLWNNPVKRVNPGDATLSFVSFFDWNVMNYLDYQYYQVRITSFRDQPQLVNRDALIEWRNVKVFIA